MRFKRWPRISAYEDTSRKRAALSRSQRLAREKLPLLADIIAETQPDADEEMARRAVWWPRAQQRDRDRRAANWREARTRIAAFDPPVRSRIFALWRDCPYPADPGYLMDLLTDVERGRVDPERPPWKNPRALTPKTTPDPKTFDEALRQIGRRKINGGPKTTESDEISFVGNLSGALLFLTSRLSLIDPNESFYTSSGHRLRDSKVGAAGHYVQIDVRGECSDAELRLIEDLARAAESRPVVVRRANRRTPV
jgi:hypothetical protein